MNRQLILSTLTSAFLATLFSTGTCQEPSSPTYPLLPELQSRQGSELIQPSEPVQLQWELQPGRRLYQELIVNQNSSCQVQGLQVKTHLKYLVLSSFLVENIDSDGTTAIRQTIESARLLEADAATQTTLTTLLKDLVGKTFLLKLNSRMQIVELQAAANAFPIAAGGNPLAGQPLIMASLVDRDGWRELNQLTFYQPTRTLKASDRWQQPMTHSWGPLGSWQGQAEYAFQGERSGLACVAYQLKLTHRPPAAAAPSALPFRPTQTTFQTEKAAGIILFDRRRGRVEQAAETFHVRGRMVVELLGQKVPIDIAEQQDFQLRLFENRLGGNQQR